MIPGDFEYQLDLQRRLGSCPNLRTLVDTIPDIEAFVYPFLTGDLLRIGQKPLPDATKKGILKSVLTGLRELHELRIFHSGELLSTRRWNL